MHFQGKAVLSDVWSLLERMNNKPPNPQTLFIQLAYVSWASLLAESWLVLTDRIVFDGLAIFFWVFFLLLSVASSLFAIGVKG